jgi:hypothetical protein
METTRGLKLAVALLALPFAAAAQEAFDACEVFTAEEAKTALGTTAVETSAFKGKRPRVVTTCNYAGSKDGKPVAASAQFRFARSDAETRQAFADARMEQQTKPVIIQGNDAFWNGRSGQLHVRKGRAWITLSVGPEKPADRDIEAARRLAEALVKKL